MGGRQQGKASGGGPRGRLMALDVGARRVGVAVCDPLGIAVRPLTTLRRSDPEGDARRIADLAREQNAARLVVGRPLHLGGEPAEVFQSAVRPLAEEAARRAGLPLDWAEERLSSKEAEALMSQAGLSGRERRRRRDEFAAAVILRWYLDEGPLK